ncbi:molybdenum cofactor biosynthesis protein MoaE [bacterium]|nr:molybdenum cofactor biosynthesis protein MoaE [Mariniblastus sp.]MDA7905258.1 molybdenum cofactor biosynthesis protein MoaE [Mariniblastus sp.]MDB4379983.1 molybdenum cofactor biosynthesis protein MoaE [Mariniblastus sp.]MDB4399769.1 molybdenum cofactor biosynthesis protein MoaE [bacterium]
MISITSKAIDTKEVLESVKSDQAGASVLFVGSTRQFTGEKETIRLEYECYESMALEKIQQLVDLAQSKWDIQQCSVVHRTGLVGLGESSIAVAVSTGHRKESFEAAAWLVDELKIRVPIWKKEIWADGKTEWVHPAGGQQPNPGNLNHPQGAS